MNDAFFEATAALCCAACLVAVICRVNKLSGETLKLVRLQFAVLGGGCFGGLVAPFLPHGLGRALLALSVLVFLVLGAKRWRHGAPAETTKPAPLDACSLNPGDPK